MKQDNFKKDFQNQIGLIFMALFLIKNHLSYILYIGFILLYFSVLRISLVYIFL